jgi:2-succinyl-6-hydroxy-2,4-cyclohexadiene-1-carboxylate synthase
MKSQFVHGFLGSPNDWLGLPTAVTKEATFRNLWEDLEVLAHTASFDAWADLFLQTSPRGVKAFGYSLGGRLLLHAYIKDPSHFKSLHLFSTHYGLQSEVEKQARLKNDLTWAKRFETDPWQEIMAAWNSQPVLANSHEPERLEEDFDRDLLAQAFRIFSLGRQTYLLPELVRKKVPIHFINGENDPKFMTLLDAIPIKPHLHTHRLPNVGHRILWEYPFTGEENWW